MLREIVVALALVAGTNVAQAEEKKDTPKPATGANDTERPAQKAKKETLKNEKRATDESVKNETESRVRARSKDRTRDRDVREVVRPEPPGPF